ncbi:uncharacterized protein At4g17910 isoform X2 [Impatiens glandulifera]|nr:uncharacterized protein At4g17910 isoform X2 [Impatiens glandulifera]
MNKKTSVNKNEDGAIGFKNMGAYMSMLAIDFLLIVVPIVLSFTVLSEWIYTVALMLTSLLIFFVRTKRYKHVAEKGNDSNSLRSNVSSYRVTMMLVTCFSILAVDFRIFPRRFAKTETYGTSLMDLGVGSFVFANSLVSRQARGIQTVKLKNIIQSTSPLLLLGFGRLVSTAGIHYQVHVGEYGVHWNFFFTLAAVSILTSVINISPRYCGALGLSILVGYEVILMKGGLNAYLLSNERGKDIISQNKEGIFSIFGYLGLYLVGVHLGNYLIFGDSGAILRTNKWAKSRVYFLSIFFWLLTMLLDEYVEEVSRRMCNVGYVTFVLAQNLQVLAILMEADRIPGYKMSLLEQAINRNLLGTFLLANILTGLVNMFVETLFVSTLTSIWVLIGYALLLSFTMGLADFCGIRFKFW